MRYEVYSINGLQGVAKSLKAAMRLTDLPANTRGKFGILVKERKHSYPHSGIGGSGGVATRHTMLLYPPGATCRMLTYEGWLAEVLK